MKTYLKKPTILTLIALMLSFHVCAQEDPTPVSAKEQKEVINAISQLLEERYVFPEVAKKMADQLKRNLKNGKYKDIKDPFEFQSHLSKELVDISKDKHLRVMFNPKAIEEQKQATTPEDEKKLFQQMVQRNSMSNFGFHEVKVLEGNIGYLDLRSFQGTDYAGDTAVAAMNFLSHTDAIIIDLRQNGGGSPQMIQLITSYLYDAEPVHLNNFYYRPKDQRTQTWTLPHVSGKRNPDAAVYVLTSNRTFSAAEEFSYNLKHLERATLIGETTGGGAHPGGTQTATDRFQVWIPTGRAINPITQTNWEGTGVTPHIQVPKEQAFDKAYIKALEDLQVSHNDESSQALYQWIKEGLNARSRMVELTDGEMQLYVGHYGPRRVTIENGGLYYQRGEGSKYQLVPMGSHQFLINEIPYFRIQFELENDQVTALMGKYDNGRKDKNNKD